MRDEDRIKEFQVWRFKSLAQRFPQLWEKVASLEEKKTRGNNHHYEFQEGIILH
jgi:hypothetical protein